MSVVRAAGLVVYRMNGTVPEFLLLKASYKPFHWTPPKGHLEAGEDEWTAALRETKEESNIDASQLEIFKDCYEVQSYKAHGKDKTVKYWLALLKNPDGVGLSDEHQNLTWAAHQEAIRITEYPEMKTLFDKFSAYIQSKQ